MGNRDKGTPSDLLAGLVPVTVICQQLGVNRHSLRAYEAIGFPPRVKIGRVSYYSAAAVRRWVAARAGEIAA